MTSFLEETLEPTDVTKGWVIDNIKGKNPLFDDLIKKSEVKNITLKVISGGYLSNVGQVSIKFKNGEVVYGFLKAPTTQKFQFIHAPENAESLMNRMDKQLIIFHNHELLFYQLIGTNYPLLKFTNVYGGQLSTFVPKFHGMFLIEDLSHVGVLQDFDHGVSLEQCVDLFTKLAEFHAYTRYMNNSEEILEQFKEPSLLELYEHELELAVKLTELNDDYINENLPVMQKMFQKHAVQVLDPHLLFNVKPVLTHGDLWVNNVFWHKGLDGKASNKLLTIFDWQVTYLGTGLNDLARFIALSTNADIQEEHTEYLLRVYYDVFKSELENNGHEIDYDFEKLKEMYEFQYPHECIFAYMILLIKYPDVTDEKIRSNYVGRLRASFNRIKHQFV